MIVFRDHGEKHGSLYTELPHAFSPPDRRLGSDPTMTHGSQLSHFIKYSSVQESGDFPTYLDFEQFAIREFRLFWRSFLAWSNLISDGPFDPVCVGDSVEY